MPPEENVTMKIWELHVSGTPTLDRDMPRFSCSHSTVSLKKTVRLLAVYTNAHAEVLFLITEPFVSFYCRHR